MRWQGSCVVAVEAKICGLTRPADAELAVRLGANRLGVIFAGGPRQVTLDQARAIVTAAAGVPVLGVFASQSASEILSILETTGLRGAQLHSSGPHGRAAELRAAGFEVWGVATLDSPDSVEQRISEARSGADLVLVEPRAADGRGGHGIALSAPLVREVRSAMSGGRWALAGGLRPENVADAVRLGGPDLVDVSSGVESAPGIKDPVLLARFLEIIRDVRPAQ